MEAFNREKLKTVDQLPGVTETKCEFLWDLVEDENDLFQEIQLKDRLIWRELAFWENKTRFDEIEDLLRQKYRGRSAARAFAAEAEHGQPPADA